MGRIRTLWLIFFICVFLFQTSTARHGPKLPSAMVVGKVFCDTCSQRRFTEKSYFLSGASVLIECRDLQGKVDFTEFAKTNRLGEFEVLLPFEVKRKVKSIRKCSVQLVESSINNCSTPSTSTISSLKIKSRKQGVHVFSAGFFTFKPIKVPQLCHQKTTPAQFSQIVPAKNGTSVIGSNPTIQDHTPLSPTLNPVTDPLKGTKSTVSSLDSRASKMVISLTTPLPFLRLPPITIGFDPSVAPPSPILHSDPLKPPFYRFPPGVLSMLPPPSFSFPVPPSAPPGDEPLHPRNSPLPASKEISP